MMLKVNDEYLDFDGDIEIERQVKLFEEIDTTDGDYSYEFDLQYTSHNARVLGLPFPDNSTKIVYQKINCQVLGNDGMQIYDGFLRVERITDVISVSFFSGNNNWFGLLSGPLSDIDFSDLDVDQTLSNLLVYANNDEGIVFPTVDNGGLITRSYRQMKLEDFVAGIYVKTVFKRIFQHHSIKIQGDLLNDVTYNSIVTLKNGKSQSELDANASFVEKTSTTSRPGENVRYKVTFDNDSTYPYFDGANNNFDLANSKYVAPVRMRIDIECTLTPSVVDSSYNNRIYIYINGVFTFVDIGLPSGAGGLYNSGTPGDQPTFTIKRTFILEAGDELEIYAEWQQSSGSTQNDVISGTLKITPSYIFKVFGNSVVPNWTQQQYVSNVLRMFNVLTNYDPFTKTLTFDLFEKIKSKEPLDLSPYISSTEVDYVEFISNYGKRNLLSYNEVDFDDLRDYNIENFFKYGQGSVDVDNDFLSDSEDIVELDFSNPIGYINSVFDMSMERLNLISLENGDSTDITSVSDSSGVARIVLDRTIFQDGDLVRIEESTNPLYNGDYVVNVQSSNYVELYGLNYDSDATGKITKLIHKYNETDDVYLLWNIPFYLVTKFSGHSNIRWEGSDRTEVPVGYFSLLNTDRQINEDFKQSLSFGGIENTLFYQRTLIQSYWNVFSRVLNDPVKLLSNANIPYRLFLKMDFLMPIVIKTLETSNLYYQNRITGYTGSENDCIVELIKLP